jgi:hypothetical protein
MAAFCKQCSEDTFGKDFGDLIPDDPTAAEGDMWPSLCEGCVTDNVLTLVNMRGECVASDCKIHAREQKQT